MSDRRNAGAKSLSKPSTTAPPARDGEVVPQGTPDEALGAESGPLAVPTRRLAETTAFQSWCRWVAELTWTQQAHQDAAYLALVGNENVRHAYSAGAASRQGEVDRLTELLKLYRAARAVGPGDQRDRYLDSLDEQLVEVFGE